MMCVAIPLFGGIGHIMTLIERPEGTVEWVCKKNSSNAFPANVKIKELGLSNYS